MEKTTKYLETMTDLQDLNIKLIDLCNKYEEEHNTTFKEWLKDIKTNKKAIEYMEENERAFIVSLGIHYYKLLEILRGEE